MCVNYLKRSCAPHLKTLLNNCLPNTPFDVIVEHAIQYERAQDLEKNQKKAVKRKSDEIDLVDDVYSDTECSKPKFRKEMEKYKQDIGNTVKQIKESVVSKIARLEPLLDNISNMAMQNVNSRFPSSYNNQPNYTRSSFSNNRTNSNNNNYKHNRNHSTTTSNQASSPRACLHCAKPNHSFYDCNTATTADKNAIRQLLRDKKFDFNKHIDRAEKLAKDKRVRFNLASLNSEAPDQQ